MPRPPHVVFIPPDETEGVESEDPDQDEFDRLGVGRAVARPISIIHTYTSGGEGVVVKVEDEAVGERSVLAAGFFVPRLGELVRPSVKLV